MARTTRRSRRKIVLIALLLLLLALVGIWFVNFNATKKLGFDIAIRTAEQVPAPQFLYSFSGSAAVRMQRPLGVLADGDHVYATDAPSGQVFEFTFGGAFIKAFGKGKLATPLYITKSPVTGNLYVTDRRLRSMEIFTPDGKWVGEFDPHLPKKEMPKFDTKGAKWEPVAVAFGPTGAMYVTDILNGHRVLFFGPDGKFIKSVGTVGIVNKDTDAPLVFQFPNSIKVHGNELWVSDSNNRRMQVLDLNGKFLRFVPTQGLPRGIDFLPPRSGATSQTPALLVVVDTLSHDCTIWNAKGDKMISFGSNGVLDGLFAYPNDVSVGNKSVIFVADTSNGRVQAWGWPNDIRPFKLPETPSQWAWCLAPLLLLPLLLLLRKKDFFTTEDFLEAMLAAEQLHTMKGGRRRWLVRQEVYDAYKDRSQGEIQLSELLEPSEYSESDVRALMEKLELDEDTAITVALAQRAKVFCTEDTELRRIARTLELDVVDRPEYLKRFVKGATTGETSESEAD